MAEMKSAILTSRASRAALTKRIVSAVRRAQSSGQAAGEAVANILRDVRTRDMLPGEPTNGFAGAWSVPVQYLSLHEDDNVSISIFLIRKGGTIPLHNHPHMTVASKVLFGEVLEQSFDWSHGNGADVPTAGKNTKRKNHRKGKKLRNGGAGDDQNDVVKKNKAAQLKEDQEGTTGEGPATEDSTVFRKATLLNSERRTSQSEVAIIAPGEPNLHYITANTTCAFLDVFSPPYDDGSRDCTYYSAHDSVDGTLLQDVDLAALEEGATVLLQEDNPSFYTGDYSAYV
eukprot:m.543367 g.543367  ORF g.543367 m.543367 type:complete len:286 (+) comp22126_c0_seq10:805-1662(+)